MAPGGSTQRWSLSAAWEATEGHGWEVTLPTWDAPSAHVYHSSRCLEDSVQHSRVSDVCVIIIISSWTFGRTTEWFFTRGHCLSWLPVSGSRSVSASSPLPRLPFLLLFPFSLLCQRRPRRPRLWHSSCPTSSFPSLFPFHHYGCSSSPITQS